MSSPPLLHVDTASLSIDGRRLLDRVSLTVTGASVLGLIGRNGSGKTTLISLLARTRRPDSGRVLCQGRPIDDWPARGFARIVAHLPQALPPAPGLTVRDLAGFGRYPHHGALGRRSADDAARVADALAATAMTGFADRQVDSLSGGERQRAWLAMALAQDARCLLLDEPTAALDIAHQIEVLGLIRHLVRDRGLGVVMVLHDVDMAARFCDRIIGLADGRVVAAGPPAAIMTPATLRAIYGLDLGVMPHPVTGGPMSFVP